MTPLAMEIYRNNPFDLALDDAHFFEVTEIIEEAQSAAASLWQRIVDSPEFANGLRLKLPFPVTWIEFVDQKGLRCAWRCAEDGSNIQVKLFVREASDYFLGLEIFNFPGGDVGPLLNRVDFREVDSDSFLRAVRHGSIRDAQSAHFSEKVLVATLLLIICSPKSFVVRQRNNRQFARAQQKRIGNKPWALGAWTEIKLEIDPDLVREVQGTAQRISGKKCFHWVIGHWRRVFGSTIRIWIAAHTRGDSALGIAQQRYAATPPARARTKAQRREIVERCARIEAVLARDYRDDAGPAREARRGRPADRPPVRAGEHSRGRGA